MAAGMLRYWLFAGVASSVFVALETQAGEERANETCPGRVVIRAQDHQTEDLICKAVELARELLEPCGLTQTRPINVQTVSEMDEKHEACVAYFDCETDSLTVLAPSAIPVSGEVISVLSQLPEDEYFQSVIVHEMNMRSRISPTQTVSRALPTNTWLTQCKSRRSLRKAVLRRWKPFKSLRRRPLAALMRLVFSSDLRSLLSVHTSISGGRKTGAGSSTVL